MNQRKGWLDEVEIINKSLKPTVIVKTTVSRDGVVKKQYIGKCGRTNITIKRSDGNLITDSSVEGVANGGKTITITRPRSKPRAKPTKSYSVTGPDVYRDPIQGTDSEMERLMNRVNGRHSHVYNQAVLKSFWEIWPYAMGSIALLCFIGFGGTTPIAVILALTLGMLAWKGKVVADYFDAVEAKAKAKKEAKLAAKVAAEAQKKIEEAQIEAKKQHGEDSSLYCIQSGPEGKTVA